MFTTIIVKPIFNLLVLVYSLLPGHNFGLSLIIFTIIVRLLLWPLVRKQLHQAKAMRELQPEIKKAKKASKGDRQKESAMLMELYKKKGINPFATFPILFVQIIVLIGLYSGLRKVIDNPHNLVTFAYPGLQHLPWLKQLNHNIHLFDDTLFGIVNLGRPALSSAGKLYIPALLIVIGSAIAQYFQSKQLMPVDKNQPKLREILRSAGEGKQAEQSDINAAVGRGTRFLLPVMIFLFTINLTSALSLYWLTGGIVAYIQQWLVLRKDEEEMEEIADEPTKKDVKNIPEAEIVTKLQSKPKQVNKKKPNPKSAKKKRK